jgi:integrative and conjugative element protein (TIGR02256 family)
MPTSWITRHPGWYIRERELLAKHYPALRVDEEALAHGALVLYGDLTIRPPGGAKTYPIQVWYPAATPFEHPIVTPLEAIPEWTSDGRTLCTVPRPKFFSRRHQMPSGNLCLFQRDTRAAGGDPLDALQVLRRASRWFMGHHTGRWPPDTAESELEAHFSYAGDILLASTFYDPKLGNHGRLFLVPDLRRVRDGDYEVVPPLILVSATKEDGLIQTFDARAELSRLYPWIENKAWDAAREASKRNYEPEDQSRLQHGYWWALPVEPAPFRDGAGLLEALTAVAPDRDAWKLVSEALRGDIASPILHFALRFPSRAGGQEWLFLTMFRAPKAIGGGLLLTTEAQKRQSFDAAPVGCLRVSRLDPSALRFRNTGVVDAGVRRKCVAFIGLGALGSEAAELLAKAGVGRFRMCDLGRLETGNAARHVGGVAQFGARKTTVVAARLLEINPYLEFSQEDLRFGSASADADTLQKFIAPADLVVCTTADENVEAVVNECALIARKPVLYARALHDAAMGRVFLVRPGTDPCKACLAGYVAAKRTGQSVPDTFIDVPEEASKPLLHECGRPVIAGSAIDLSFTSTLTARVALDFLESRTAEANHWIWTGRPTPHLDPRLSDANSTTAAAVPRDPTCPVCQEPEIREVVLLADVRAFIDAETASSPDRETGGVLIGYVENGRAHVRRATGPGPDAIRTKALFRRDVPFVQAALDTAARELGAQALYVGEWHSHLSTDTRPSATDVESLVGIAHAPNYLTRCPVMLIAGLNVSTRKVVGLSASAFPLGGRVFTIPVTAD